MFSIFGTGDDLTILSQVNKNMLSFYSGNKLMDWEESSEERLTMRVDFGGDDGETFSKL